MSKRNASKKRRRRTLHASSVGSGPENVIFDPEAPQSQVSYVAYDGDQLQEEIVTDLVAIEANLGKWPVLWVNVEGLGSPEIIKRLGEIFNIHPLAMEDIIHLHQRAKFEQYDENFFLVAHMIEGKASAPNHLASQEIVATEQISMYVGSNFVVTFQEGPVDATKPVLDRLRKGRGLLRSRGSDYLTYAIIDSIIDAYYPVLEVFGERLEVIEDRILEEPSKRIVSQVHIAKRELLGLRRALFPLREALGSILRTSPANFTAETLLHLRDCYDHVIQITDLIETYRELCSDLMDVYLSSISNRLNEVMVAVGGLGAHAFNIEALDDIEGRQGGDALAVGRALPAGDTSVVGGDGFVPVRSMAGQVLGGEPAPLLLDEGGHLLPNLPLVKGFRASLGDGPQGAGQGGQADYLTVPGSAAVEQHLLAGGQFGQLGHVDGPLVGDDVGNGETLLGVLDGRLQHFRQRHGAIGTQQGLPAMDRARDCNGVGAGLRHLVVAQGL